MPTVTVKNEGTGTRTYYDAKGKMIIIRPNQHKTFEAHEHLHDMIASASNKGDKCKLIASSEIETRTNEEALGPVESNEATLAELAENDAGADEDIEGINTPAPVLDSASELDDTTGEETDAQPQDIAARSEVSDEQKATAARLQAAMGMTETPTTAASQPAPGRGARPPVTQSQRKRR